MEAQPTYLVFPIPVPPGDNPVALVQGGMSWVVGADDMAEAIRKVEKVSPYSHHGAVQVGVVAKGE